MIYEYDATRDPDGGADAVWQHNVNAAGKNRNLTLGTATTYQAVTSSYVGIKNAYRFDGTADAYAITGTGTSKSFGRDGLPLGGTRDDVAGASAAFEIWAKPSRASWIDAGNEVLFETGGTTHGLYIALLDDPAGALLRFRVRHETQLTGQPARNVQAEVLLSDDALLADFLQVVGVVEVDDEAVQDFAGTNGRVKLYVNGALAKSTNGFASWQDGNNDAGIGSIGGGTAQSSANVGANRTGTSGTQTTFAPYLGDVALVCIYDAPLSAQEVSDRWAAVVPEPASAMLVVLGLALGVARRRRA